MSGILGPTVFLFDFSGTCFELCSPVRNPRLGFLRSVGLAFHFEILRISTFHRPTSHGALTSFSPAKIRFLDFLIAQLCRSFGFASTRFELRSPGFTRTWSLFTDIGVFSCQLFYRDAIFFSSPQLAKKRRQIRFLDFLIAQLCRSFGFASTRFELRSSD